MFTSAKRITLASPRSTFNIAYMSGASLKKLLRLRNAKEKQAFLLHFTRFFVTLNKLQCTRHKK